MKSKCLPHEREREEISLGVASPVRYSAPRHSNGQDDASASCSCTWIKPHGAVAAGESSRRSLLRGWERWGFGCSSSPLPIEGRMELPELC